MSYSDYGSYLNRRVNKQNCCCQKGATGPRGPGAIDGTSPQLAYVGTTPDVINSTPAATAGSTTQILFADGSEAVPVISFQGDPNTGMYSTGPDSIGFSTNGNQKLTIAHTDGAPADMIRGVNVGTAASTAGIRRVCLEPDNSWEEGNAGNSSQLVFVPSDFMIANSRTGPAQAASSTSYMNLVTNGIGGTAFVATGAGYGQPVIGTTNTAACLVATKLIPKGFRITPNLSKVTIFGRSNTLRIKLSVAVRRVEDASGGAVPIPEADPAYVNLAYLIGTEATLTGVGLTPGKGDGRRFIIIFIQPDPAVLLTSDNGIRGAIVTMKRY